MDMIVRGEPQELDFVRCICRDKVRRGLIAILPAPKPAVDDVKKMMKEHDEAVSENAVLKERIAELENRLTTTAEAYLATGETQETETSEKETEETPVADTKEVAGTEDFKEVDLDADTKEVPVDDTKEVKKTAKKTTKKKTE